MFHMLPRPYIRSFDGNSSDLIFKKEWVLNLAKRPETFVLEKIDLMIMSEVSTDVNTNLPLNERDNDLDNQLSFNNFRMTVRKLYDCGWKNSSQIYLLMWICLVMDAVCLCILSFMTRK